MAGHVLSYLLTDATKAAHRATWYVWSGDGTDAYPWTKIPHQSTMRGQWGYDVTCSCGGFESKTGGATRRSVEDMLFDHRYSEQCAREGASR